MAKVTLSAMREYRHDNGETLPYRFVRSSRKTLGLYVHRDATVTVRVPRWVSQAEVQVFMHERWAWLQAQRQKFQNEPMSPRFIFCHGAELMHLGQLRRLQIEAGKRKAVQLENDVLRICLPEGQQAEETQIAKAVDGWQKEIGKVLFAERLQYCYQAMAALGLPYPTIRIRRMRTRWGTCSKKGDITLNLELLRMPLDCIDYVIVHELCHLREFNHGKAFYALQSRFLPDWQERKQRLETLAREPIGVIASQ